jgi:hypothetical protein
VIIFGITSSCFEVKVVELSSCSVEVVEVLIGIVIIRLVTELEAVVREETIFAIFEMLELVDH